MNIMETASLFIQKVDVVLSGMMSLTPRKASGVKGRGKDIN